MFTFKNARYRYAPSAELHRELGGIQPIGLRSVEVSCECGKMWTARPGDGRTSEELGGARITCPGCRREGVLSDASSS